MLYTFVTFLSHKNIQENFSFTLSTLSISLLYFSQTQLQFEGEKKCIRKDLINWLNFTRKTNKNWSKISTLNGYKKSWNVLERLWKTWKLFTWVMAAFSFSSRNTTMQWTSSLWNEKIIAKFSDKRRKHQQQLQNLQLTGIQINLDVNAAKINDVTFCLLCFGLRLCAMKVKNN